MKEVYKEAYTEISEIFKLMPRTMLNKIPNKFVQMVDTQKSTSYIPNITEPLEQCTLKEETKVILYMIYRDFLCDKEEKSKLKYRDSQKLKEAEEELRKKYNPDDIFKSNETVYIEELANNIAIMDDRESLITKIMNKIKLIFKKT